MLLEKTGKNEEFCQKTQNLSQLACQNAFAIECQMMWRKS